MTMTPDQLREWNATRPFPHPNEAQEIIFEGHRCVVMDPECYEACFKQAESHAAALEEIERLNAAWKAQHAAWKAQQFHLEAEERESAHWQERAEKAERRAERLKGHAEAMAPVGMLDPLRIIGDRLLAHYGDRFGLTRPTLHTDHERQVLVAALKALRAGLAYRADKGE